MRKSRRKVVIFGASAGIGRELARSLSSRYPVLAVSRSGELAGQRQGVVCVRADVREYSSVSGIFDSLEGCPLRAVVNCAGVGWYAPVNDDYSRYWAEMFQTNVVGMLNIVANLERRNVCDHFIHISSLAAHRPSSTPGSIVYAASKTACASILLQMRKSIRQSRSRMKVSMISPGFVGGTNFEKRYFESAPTKSQPLYDRFKPLSVSDVVRAVEWVLTGDAEVTEICMSSFEQPD